MDLLLNTFILITYISLKLNVLLIQVDLFKEETSLKCYEIFFLIVF